MKPFATIYDYHRFARVVATERRFVLTPEQQSFVQAVVDSSGTRVIELPRGKELWRAQIGCVFREVQVAPDDFTDVPEVFSRERMKPLRDRANEGRANPRGIPHLYLAETSETAVAESRPWVGAMLTVAPLTTNRCLRIVNCHVGSRAYTLYLREPTLQEKERDNWREIDRAFSQPVVAAENQASYAATQILTEVFKAAKFDGIRYRSSLGGSANVVLFDLDAADVGVPQLLEVTAVNYQVKER